MLSRFSSATVLGLCIVSALGAQTVRFDTNVGTFDLELNPTGNANLQPHVDNMMAYVNAGRYDLTVINRAATGFVLQLGGFKAETLTLPVAFADFGSVEAFAPLIVDADGDNQVDFDLTGLNNTTGTVSLALSSNVNTGNSSFFINLDTNTNLDSSNMRFVPFAKISDMATIDLIMSLDQVNYNDGGLAGDNVPSLPDQRMVFVEQAYMLEESIEAAAATVQAATLEDDGSSLTAPALASAALAPALTVPEPSTFALAALALLAAATMKRRQLS